MPSHKWKESERQAYVTHLQGIDLSLDNVWRVGNAGEFHLIWPRAVQPLIQEFLGFLCFDHIHRTFCQPADAAQPFQVWLVHILQINQGLLTLNTQLDAQRGFVQGFPHSPSHTVTQQALNETVAYQVLPTHSSFAQQGDYWSFKDTCYMQTRGVICKQSASKLQTNVLQGTKTPWLPYELPGILLAPNLKTLLIWKGSSWWIKITIPGLTAGSWTCLWKDSCPVTNKQSLTHVP